MDSVKMLRFALVISLYPQIGGIDKTCGTPVQSCPTTEQSWKKRAASFPCSQRDHYYACIFYKDDRHLIESCILNLTVPSSAGGCPTVIFCDERGPVLSFHSDYIPCPREAFRCPRKGHGGYNTTQLYKYPFCVGEDEYENVTTTFTRITIEVAIGVGSVVFVIIFSSICTVLICHRQKKNINRRRQQERSYVLEQAVSNTFTEPTSSLPLFQSKANSMSGQQERSYVLEQAVSNAFTEPTSSLPLLPSNANSMSEKEYFSEGDNSSGSEDDNVVKNIDDDFRQQEPRTVFEQRASNVMFELTTPSMLPPSSESSMTGRRKIQIEDTNTNHIYQDVCCPEFTYDKRAVHKDCEVSSDAKVLRNRRTEGSCTPETGMNFQCYKGVVGTFSFKEAGIYYYEVDISFTIDQPLEKTLMVFELGICRWDDIDKHYSVDKHMHARSCYVARIPEDGKLAVEVWHNHIMLYHSSRWKNVSGTSVEVTFGLYVDTKLKIWKVADRNQKYPYVLDGIDFTEALWPVFGVYNPENVNVEMRLRTGNEITEIPAWLR